MQLLSATIDDLRAQRPTHPAFWCIKLIAFYFIIVWWHIFYFFPWPGQMFTECCALNSTVVRCWQVNFFSSYKTPPQQQEALSKIRSFARIVGNIWEKSLIRQIIIGSFCYKLVQKWNFDTFLFIYLLQKVLFLQIFALTTWLHPRTVCM